MPTTVTPRLNLSGGTDGKPIAVTATATPGTTIHAAHATALDEIVLFAANTHTSDLEITIEDGSTAAPIKVTIPTKQGYWFLGIFLLTNAATVKIFCATASVIFVRGHVVRYTG